MAALPGEFTVMSGRRMRNMLKQAAAGYPVSNVALSGLNNMYTHYVTTPEEYGGQRYEAASTIFGPNTLNAYLEQYEMLLAALLTGGSVSPGPTPDDLLDDQVGATAVFFSTLLCFFLFVRTNPWSTQPDGKCRR